jgi:hypothetical protein
MEAAVSDGRVFGREHDCLRLPGALPTARSRSCALRDEQRRGSAAHQSRSDVLTGIIGARRAWTVSTISALSMPSR